MSKLRGKFFSQVWLIPQELFPKVQELVQDSKGNPLPGMKNVSKPLMKSVGMTFENPEDAFAFVELAQETLNIDLHEYKKTGRLVEPRF